MKKTILASLLIICAFTVFAQTFAPVGAKWHYTTSMYGSYERHFATAESLKDTLIQGKMCQMIVTNASRAVSGNQYFSTSNDTVFYFDQNREQFYPFMVFNAQPGDSWWFLTHQFGQTEDTVCLIVQSISTETINNQTLRVLAVNANNSAQIDTLKEKLGFINYLFSYLDFNMIWDYDWTEGLRCYQDNQFGSYAASAQPCEYSTLGIAPPVTQAEITIYNDPTNGLFLCSWSQEQNQPVGYRLMNLTGQLVEESSIPFGQNHLELNLVNEPAGLYFLSLYDDNQVLITKKIVKE